MSEWRSFDILWRTKLWGGERWKFSIGDDVHEYRLPHPLGDEMEALATIADAVSDRSPLKYTAQAIVNPLIGSGLRVTACGGPGKNDWLDIETPSDTITCEIMYPKEHEGPQRARVRYYRKAVA